VDEVTEVYHKDCLNSIFCQKVDQFASPNLHSSATIYILQQIPELSESHPIFQQLTKLDLAASLKNFESAKAQVSTAIDTSSISPVDNVFNWLGADINTKKNMQNIGKACIRDGKAAAVILSGGQGTRLGFAGPKGMYNMGLISGKSIFQLHIERIAKVRILSKSSSGVVPSVPIYIMTSDMNDTIIREYFTSMNFFGYPASDIFFFEQGLEPCLTFDGKLIIDNPSSLSLAPDGNGGK
jgi:UDP-N-acetylglucosamine/UDP-N-acetylgalactosamine diphosphorylase